ncbi:MAG: class I SAM-dependent methyltransferase [Bacillus sp. (in: firmicutes)]
MGKTTKETYDALSGTYEKDVDHDNPYNAYYERPAMLSKLKDDLSGTKVLDAGCAAGWYSEKLANRGAEVTGIDMSEEMIEAAKRKAGDRAEFFVHDLEKQLPFGDKQFDLILSSLTLHYIKDWSNTLAEFKRILKPGGRLLFSVHHPYMDFHEFHCNDYFAVEKLTDTWKKPEITIEVSFYRRPLREITGELNRHFTIRDIFEPQPIQRMQEVDEKAYHYLMKKPHFLIVESEVGQ